LTTFIDNSSRRSCVVYRREQLKHSRRRRTEKPSAELRLSKTRSLSVWQNGHCMSLSSEIIHDKLPVILHSSRKNTRSYFPIIRYFLQHLITDSELQTTCTMKIYASFRQATSLCAVSTKESPSSFGIL
jgi:5-formyltetrahydrofolate cyclo-ligase